ncbi:hypothetical protein BKA70DRAFT_1263008 [Coprinopsis sp. MPI-PUGE-AT-0042]|nr:hypothetical protein BKA70DRAFT_1263008 [Coprinopsis sp. MPI-PUGE-AT-0042]
MPQAYGMHLSVDVRDGEWRPLPEFKHEWHQAEGFVVGSCWVPSEAGKAFRVNIKVPPVPRPSHWLFGLNLDGSEVVVKGNALEKSSRKAEISMEEGYRSSASTSTFQFANIRLTDDDEALGWANEKLGEITVDLWSVAQWQYVPHYDPGSTSSVLGGETVHEREKKATTHCITYGEQRATGASKGWSQPIGAKLEAKIIFKYMNIDMLMAQGIAPPGSAPGHSLQPMLTMGRLKQERESPLRFEIASPRLDAEQPEGRANATKLERGWGDVKPQMSAYGPMY